MSRLTDLKRILAPSPRIGTGVVESRLTGERVSVRLADGSLATCAGTAEIGSTVMVRDGVVVARTARQASRKYHVTL